MRRRVRRWMPGFVTVLALACVGPASASAPAGEDWPALGRGNAHTAYAADPRMDVAVAKRLGLRWMTNLYSPDLGSPVVAWDAALHKMVVYVGDEHGDVRALDEADGSTLWSTSLGAGDSLRSTPLVSGGEVWAGTSYGDRLYQIDAGTGAIGCNVKGPASFLASAMAATIAGTTYVYDSTIDEPAFSGPFYGINASTCAETFSFTNYVLQTGPWASPAYGVDALGRNLVVFGTADPDAKVYAVDALTGTTYWVFKSYNPYPGTYDIGAAATISKPGANGFADGVVYVPSKYGIMYALDLTTGAMLWQFNFNAAAGVTEGGISSAALVGTTIVFGYNGGIFALNAITGAPLWQWVDPTGTEVVASPAIAGPKGKEVVAFADMAGLVRVLRLADGALLYSYQTRGYMTASVAETRGHFIAASSDGYVYDFGAGGGNVAPPATTIAFPAAGASLSYRSGTVSIGGTATDATSVRAVEVAVQYGGSSGMWWDAATNGWSSGPVSNAATLERRGGGTAVWRLNVEVPPAGGAFSVYANAVNAGNQADVRGVQRSFTVRPSRHAPVVNATPSQVAPGTSFAATATGFAPNEAVTFQLGSTVLAEQTSSSSGDVGPVTLTVPDNAVFGTNALAASGATGDTAVTSVDIANAWAQYGYGAAHGFFEPNDDAFRRVLHVGPGIFLGEAWYAPTGAAMESSPAIVDHVAYAGNDAGVFSAIATANGAPVWTYALPSKAAIRSSPAVDAGLAIFGADDGTLYRLSAATGAPAPPIPLGAGSLTSPAVAGGTIYVASRTGKIFAVNESSASVVWEANVGHPVSASPTVDVAGGYVVISDDTGHVSAYLIANGTRAWRTLLGGALKGSPVVAGGYVYAGSSNGTMFALSETTGAFAWGYAVGSPITAAPALAPGQTGFSGSALYIGSADGYVTALDTASPTKPVYHIPLASTAIVGLGAANGDLVFAETAGGVVSATRGPNDGFDFWNYQTASTLDTNPVVLDGAVYVAAGDGGIYAFSPYGQAPQNRRRATRGSPRPGTPRAGAGDRALSGTRTQNQRIKSPML